MTEKGKELARDLARSSVYLCGESMDRVISLMAGVSEN